VPFACAQAGHRVYSSFEYVTARDGDTQTSSGALLYRPDTSLTIHVTSPLDQWMVFAGDTLLIYYPEENTGLKIPSLQGKVSLPIFQLVINAGKEDLGLSAAGFELQESQMSGDTLVAVWQPPAATRKVLGNFKATFVRDSVVSVVGLTPDGRETSRQEFSDYVRYEGQLFPRSVTVTQYGGEGETKETIRFAGVVFDAEAAADMERFSLPPDVVITIVPWQD